MKLEEALRRHAPATAMLTTPAFKVAISEDFVFKLLAERYLYNVARRGMQLVCDSETEANLWAVARALTNGTAKRGFWLYGSVGNGKTTMLYTIAQTISSIERRFFQGVDDWFDGHARFVTAKEVCETAEARALRDPDRKFEWAKLVRKSILCIDDVGNEPREISVYGNVITPMMDLLWERYLGDGLTFVSSNLAPAIIEEKYESRIADRCREMFLPIKFRASSYRK